MASPVGPQDTGHADTVHDVQLDYYGRKLATASSDRTIRVFDVTHDQLTPLTTLHGHEGPVWQISWSHPKFGNLLASCSFDNKVMIWKEQQDGSWTPVRALSENCRTLQSDWTSSYWILEVIDNATGVYNRLYFA